MPSTMNSTPFIFQESHSTATTPAIAIAAAARLPPCAPTAAAPDAVDVDPDAVFEAEDPPVAVAVLRTDVRPRLDAAAAPEADVTTVCVQEQDELKECVV